MPYVHTYARYGTAGFCRSGSYGIPQFETNTMRICTLDAKDVQYDAAVPVGPKWKGAANTFSQTEYCSQSSSDVPWSLDDINDADPAMFSAGNYCPPMTRSNTQSRLD